MRSMLDHKQGFSRKSMLMAPQVAQEFVPTGNRIYS